MGAGVQTKLPGDILFESSIDAMIAMDCGQIVTAWNHAASNLFDRGKDDAMGKALFDLLPSTAADDDLQEAIRHARGGMKGFLPASSLHPHRRHSEIHVIPLQATEENAGVMLLVHDVSHRIVMEIELKTLNQELQKRLRQLRLVSSELAQLTHIASHNIRKPIRDIYTALEGLLTKEASVMSNSGRAAFRRIQSSLNRMNLLLDDINILTQINISAAPETSVSMEDLLEELKSQFAKSLQENGVQLSVGSVCSITGHRSQVLLLLQHIFSNLLKFIPDTKPFIHVNCEEFYYEPKKENAGRPGRYFVLCVTHNSPAFVGAEPGPKLVVLDNADIRNYTGPAITMVIAATIMEAHGGFLTVEKASVGNTIINCFFPSVNDALSVPPPDFGNYSQALSR